MGKGTLYNRVIAASENAINKIIEKEFSLESCSVIIDQGRGSINVDGYAVNDIKIDDTNNLRCKIPQFIPMKYLPIIGKLLIELFENKGYYTGRSWIHFYIEFFRYYEEELTKEDFIVMFRHPKFKDGGFKEWLIGDSYSTGGHIQYYDIKNKYTKKELKAILTTSEIGTIAEKHYAV